MNKTDHEPKNSIMSDFTEVIDKLTLVMNSQLDIIKEQCAEKESTINKQLELMEKQHNLLENILKIYASEIKDGKIVTMQKTAR